MACCDHRGTGGAAHPHSIWAVTDRGDILVHEPDPYLFTESATDMYVCSIIMVQYMEYHHNAL